MSDIFPSESLVDVHLEPLQLSVMVLSTAVRTSSHNGPFRLLDLVRKGQFC